MDSNSNCSVTETTIDNNNNNDKNNNNNNVDFWKKTRSMKVTGKLQKNVDDRCYSMVKVKRSVKLLHVRLTSKLSLVLNLLLMSLFCVLINHIILQRFIYWLYLSPAGQLYVYVYIEVTQWCVMDIKVSSWVHTWCCGYCWNKTYSWTSVGGCCRWGCKKCVRCCNMVEVKRISQVTQARASYQ